MRKSLFSALSLVILVGVLAPNGIDAFDRDRVAGSYAGNAELTSAAPPGAITVFPALFVIHADKTYLFRGPNLVQGLSVGVWRKGNTPRQIRGQLEQFEFGFGPDTLVSRKLFTTFVQTFDKDFNTFTGEAIITFFDCFVEVTAIVCGGPPDIPSETLFFNISGTRISAN
ncbi:MAG: hypothetical protein ACE5I0_09475 [Candidatus Binatia bacterium]